MSFDRNNIRTMRDLVYTAAERFGDETFMMWNKKKEMFQKTYNEVKHDIDAVGAWLEANTHPHTHAVLIGGTAYEYVVAWLGAAASGNVAIPLSPANNADALADEINRSDSEIIFFDETNREKTEKLKTLCPQVKYYISISNSDDGLCVNKIVSEYSGKKPSCEIDPKSLAAIIFTSGTTGQSKGVMLSHSNITDNATCESDKGYHGDKRLSILPIHHVFCFVCDIAATFWFGRVICINDSLMRIPKNFKLYQPHTATVVPMIAVSLLNKMKAAAKDNPDKLAVGREFFGENLKILYAGGSYLNPIIIDGYKEFGIEIAQGYGMTECSPRISTGIKNCPKPQSVGVQVTGCEIKTVDGELWVRSPSVMMGYYKNPEETAKTLTEDGWLKTGDLGYVDEDGFVFLTGRKKNLIILDNGENVSPEELENKFSLFDPVKEVVVYGDNGVITAEVYPNPDYKSDDIKAEIQSKIDEINDTMPTTHHINALVIRDTPFEKTASNKIKRASITKI